MLATIPLGGNIVKEQYIGNTHILVCDAAYVGKGPEDIQRVLDEIARVSLRIILNNQSDPL